MIKFKIDILEQLKAKGYSTYIIRKEKLLAETTLTAIRNGTTANISMKTLGTLCQLLNMDVSEIIEYVED